MAIQDLLHFNRNSYRTKLYKCTSEHLAENIYRKRREIASSGWSIGAGVALTPLTAGTSVLGSIYAGRTMSIAHQKLELLDEEWARRGYLPLPINISRDLILPCAISGAVGAIGLGLDTAFEQPLSAASEVTHLAHNMIPGQNTPAYSAVHFDGGFVHGVHQGVDAVLSPHQFHVSATPHPHIDPYYCNGQWVGLEGTKFAFKTAVSQAGDHLKESYANHH